MRLEIDPTMAVYLTAFLFCVMVTAARQIITMVVARMARHRMKAMEKGAK
jgi:hypothetical protein